MMASFIYPDKNVHKKLSQRLSDIFHQGAFKTITSEESKLRTYGKIKKHIGFESYLNDVTNVKNRVAMTKLRLSNHKLMIEVGRHQNIDKNNRLCPACSVIETAIHFLAECPLYADLRSLLLNPLIKNAKYTDEEKLTTLFGAREWNRNLATYIRESFQIRDSLQTNQ